MSYVPPIDGLRGVGVLVVLIGHAGYNGLHGAFLAVSTFFTLSGFLIGSLLLDEIGRTGRVSLRRFWTRRARRLMPALWVTLMLVIVLRPWLGPSAAGSLPGDVFSSIFYVLNWHFIAAGSQYVDIFSAPSPVQHLWSLSIEEQFYVVLPLLFIGLRRIGRSSYLRPALVVGGLTLATLAVAGYVYNADGLMTAYYRTDVRAPEMLIGLLLAFAFASPKPYEFLSRRPDVVNAIGLAASVALGLLWWRVGWDDPLLFPVWSAANAVAVCGLIYAFLAPNSIVARAFSVKGLPALGRISYGVYVLHFPLYLVVQQQTTLSRSSRFVLVTVLSIALAALMLRLIENPIRYGRVLPNARFIGASTLSVVVITGLVWVGPGPRPSDVVNLGDIKTNLGPIRRVRAEAEATGARRVLVAGDSQSFVVGGALDYWGRDREVRAVSWPVIMCGAGGPGHLRYLGLERDTPPDCALWHRDLRKAVSAFQPDVVVVVFSIADLSNRRFAGGRWRHIGQADFDSWLVDRMVRIARDLGSTGARVVWTTAPYVDIPEQQGVTGHPPFEENETARVDRLNDLIREIPKHVPAVEVVDLATEVKEHLGSPSDRTVRPDGAHYSRTAARKVAAWLGPRILAATR